MSGIRRELVEITADDIVEYVKSIHGVTVDIADVVQIVNTNIGWVLDIVEGEDVDEYIE